MNIPDKKVQLVHLNGPFKGEIQDFFESVIVIGRHPDCQLVFPSDSTAISRKHAEIRREGNRFKFLDYSANGTLINGIEQKDVFLKDGDVLIIGGEGGPKVSFLSSKVTPEEKEAIASSGDMNRQQDPSVSLSPPDKVQTPKIEESPENVPLAQSLQKSPVIEPLPSSSMKGPRDSAPIPTVNKSFIIQYGATLTSFKKLPIIIGSGSDCDCTLQHHALLDHHAQIFFRDNQYWVKDLTGRGMLTVNLRPVQSESSLQPDTCLALTPQGPKFQFLGEGRLAEIETTEESEKRLEPVQSDKYQQQQSRGSSVKPSGGGKKLFWILFTLLLVLGIPIAVWYFL
ncbi:FHA domain-containing protein [Desulfocapsa sulfexigens DSM 10523]|uniref:FHA domain-containing protein n=1 Tax=Desulfocapsa sulfexigens (strain DSM 10523 / SB164P1) TaxID=1167006 RepID=M1PI00_DESSD|nr:FHA domain-containing protein [Desulfocapsa sulfexigens]AGF79225.1 FHA domain-containing protein [Desulfocapsa sulfexigens DSM 10523]